MDAYHQINNSGKVKQRVYFYSGEDEISHLLVLGGGDGAISVVSNAAPKLSADLMDAALAEDVQRTNEIYYRQGFRDLSKALFLETNPIPVKQAAYMMGLVKSPELRLPLTPMTEVNRQTLEQTLIKYNLIDAPKFG